MSTTLPTATTAGPSDFARLARGRRMPIQFHADLASRIYSGLALGLFAYMAMLRDGESFSIRQMQRTHKEGRDAWSGALAELLELGLVARVRWADGRGQWRTRYYLAQDHVLDADDMAYIREIHGPGCLIECSPGLGNTDIQVSSRVSRRPRKGAAQVSGVSGSVDNSAALARDEAMALVTPVAAIATAGQPSDAIAATGVTSSDTGADEGRGVAAIAGAIEERRSSSFPPPYPPHAHTAPEQPVTVSGGREPLRGIHPDTAHILEAVACTWPMLGRADQRRLELAISQRLIEGHRSDDLRQLLCSNTDGVKIPARLLLHRLAELGAPPAREPGLAPWCGACDNRWIDHGTGLHRCPVCHPRGDLSADCVDCWEAIEHHQASHGHVEWCGHCDPVTRRVRQADCPVCHPSCTKLGIGVA